MLRQLPLTRLLVRDTAYDLPIQRVGEHEYGGTHDDAGRGGPDPDSFRLLGTGRGGALREHNETFGMWSASPEKVIEELRQCGFAPLTYGRSVQRRCSLAISWYSCKVGLGICEPSP